MDSANLTGLIISMTLLTLLFIIPTVIFLTYKGIKLCKKDNAIGVVLLFIALNIFGLLIAFVIFFNKHLQHKAKKDLLIDNIQIYLDKQK